MADTTGIPWTTHTFNPWRGCTKISPGCSRCYMFRDMRRFGLDPTLVVRTTTWGEPRSWQKEAAAAGRTELVFTCSWSDWFHADADPWRDEAWALIRRCPNLAFQVLTKRHERIKGHLPADWPGAYPNVWLGVSVENRRYGLPRMDTLRTIPAPLRFLSCEPLLEDLGAVDLTGIDWLIVGGESGPDFRPMDHAWARSLRDQCRAAGVPFFFKQSSGPRPDTGIELDGQVIREYPPLPQSAPAQPTLFG
jgi:protein gp37